MAKTRTIFLFTPQQQQGWIEWIKVHAKAFVILDVLSSRQLPPHQDSFYGFINGARTAFWTPHGKFDEERFQSFIKTYVNVTGSDSYVRKNMFLVYFQDTYQKLSDQDKEKITQAISVWHRIPVNPMDVSRGSIDDLYTVYHDQWMCVKTSCEAVFSVSHLRSWYARDDTFKRGFVPPPVPCT